MNPASWSPVWLGGGGGSLWLNKWAGKEGTTSSFRAELKELKSVEVCAPGQQPAHLKRCPLPHATLNHPSGQKHEA